MSHWLRTWRQASPAVVNLDPGYCTKGWIKTPFSAPGMDVKPGWVPDSRTARHTGALLPGCVLLRSALLSSALGSAGATKPAGGPFLMPAGAAAGAVAGASGICAQAGHSMPVARATLPISLRIQDVMLGPMQYSAVCSQGVLARLYSFWPFWVRLFSCFSQAAASPSFQAPDVKPPLAVA